MIVTLSAALSYIARIDPRASLHQAFVALHPGQHIEQHVRHRRRAQYRNAVARIVCRNDRVCEVWPLDVIVSGGPLA